MSIFLKSGLGWIALCLIAQCVQASCDYDDFPKMDGMLLSSIGSNVQWNNMPLAGRSFRVSASVHQVKEFYARAWEKEVDYTEFDGWEQILHINKRCMMLVQVRRQNERFSYGRMLLTNPPAESVAQRPLASGMPVPPGAEVVSDMRSDDDIRKGHLVVLLNRDNLHATQAWYEAEMQRQGWALEGRSVQPHAVVLDYAKGRELMSVGLLRHQDATQVLLNRMGR